MKRGKRSDVEQEAWFVGQIELFCVHKKWGFQEAFCPHNSPHKPMSITWHLDRPIAANFLKKTNKLMV